MGEMQHFGMRRRLIVITVRPTMWVIAVGLNLMAGYARIGENAVG
jgi:hypothetical protein